jgi:hypothetical protein
MTEGSSALCFAPSSPRRSSYPVMMPEEGLLSRPQWWARGGVEPPLDE